MVFQSILFKNSYRKFCGKVKYTGNCCNPWTSEEDFLSSLLCYMKTHFNSCKRTPKLLTRETGVSVSLWFWSGADPQSAPGSLHFVSIIWVPPLLGFAEFCGVRVELNGTSEAGDGVELGMVLSWWPSTYSGFEMVYCAFSEG